MQVIYHQQTKWQTVAALAAAFLARETVEFFGLQADVCPYEGLRYIDPDQGVGLHIDGAPRCAFDAALEVYRLRVTEGDYRYGLLARPHLAGSTQPAGGELVEDFGTGRQPRAGRKVHAVLAYRRRLTDAEITHYSLHPLGDYNDQGNK